METVIKFTAFFGGIGLIKVIAGPHDGIWFVVFYAAFGALFGAIAHAIPSVRDRLAAWRS